MPASVKMNSTAHVISVIFQNFTNMLGTARGCNLKTCNLLKGTPQQSFSSTFSKIFKTPLKGLQLQKIICSGFFMPIISFRINSYNFSKREIYYIYYFSGCFKKFSVQQFQITLIIASVMEFRRVLGCRL